MHPTACVALVELAECVPLDWWIAALDAALLVEADGQAYHDPERDAIRDAYLGSLGHVVLRFR